LNESEASGSEARGSISLQQYPNERPDILKGFAQLEANLSRS